MACQQRSCNNCQICDFSRISDYSPSMTTGFTANLHHSAQCEYKLPYMQHPYYCPQLCHVYIWVPNVQFFLCIFVLSDKISRCKQDTVEDKWRVSRENWPVRGLKNWLFFGLQTCVKFVIFEVLAYIWYQINQKLDHLSGNNLSVWYISNSISTMRGYVQPCFEPWTGRFSHNTHQMSGCHVYLPCVMSKLYVAYLSGYTVIPSCVSNWGYRNGHVCVCLSVPLVGVFQINRSTYGHQRVLLNSEWFAPTQWSWIGELLLVGQAPSWVPRLRKAMFCPTSKKFNVHW